MPRPRSDGCRTCVRKRIKCDRSRPHCRKCLETNQLCDGPPDPEPRFQDETTQVILRVSKKTASAPKSKISLLLGRNSENVYCTFFVETYLNTSPSVTVTDFEANKTWLLACHQSPSAQPVSNLALRSLTTFYFGCAHRNVDLQRKGRILYTSTLSRLRETLVDMSQTNDFDLLAAACLLAIYEYTAMTSNTGWLKHLQGIATLLEQRGASHFRKQPYRALLSFVRTSILFAALWSGERSFLEREEWTRVLSTDDKVDSQTTSMTNLLARFPGLIEDARRQRRNQATGASPNESLETAHGLRTVLNDLESWNEKCSIVIQEHLPKSIPQPFDCQVGSTDPCTDIFWYTRLDVAASFCQYHALSILAHKWLHHLDADQDPDNWHCATTHQHAIAIHKSVSYFLIPEHSLAGAFHLLFPAYMACQALAAAQPERARLVEVLNTMAEDKGIAIARQLVEQVNRRKSQGDSRGEAVE